MDLDKLCKKALKQLGRGPDRYGLYWLQLLDWALDSEELELDRSDPRMFPLPNTLDLLHGSDPQKVNDLLQKRQAGEESEEDVLVADPKKDWAPVDRVNEVLNKLDDRLSLNNYPRPKTIAMRLSLPQPLKIDQKQEK